MLVLAWASIILLLVTLFTFVFWSWRETRVEARSIRLAFFGGVAAFAVLFLAFTWNTLRVLPKRTHADRISAEVIAGKTAWQKYLCVDCHTILGNGAYYAPDLTRAWNRFLDRSGGDEKAARAALITFLKHPPVATADRRGMPQYAMPDGDANALAEFLKWTSAIETNGWPPMPVRAQTRPSPVADRTANPRGAAAFEAAGCGACHSIGKGPIVGPDLAGVGARYDRDALIEWIRDPAAVYQRLGKGPRNSGYPLMPTLGVSASDAADIADYLAGRGGRA